MSINHEPPTQPTRKPRECDQCLSATGLFMPVRFVSIGGNGLEYLCLSCRLNYDRTAFGGMRIEGRYGRPHAIPECANV
jgi:hypothetical protein